MFLFSQNNRLSTSQSSKETVCPLSNFEHNGTRHCRDLALFLFLSELLSLSKARKGIHGERILEGCLKFYMTTTILCEKTFEACVRELCVGHVIKCLQLKVWLGGEKQNYTKTSNSLVFIVRPLNIVVFKHNIWSKEYWNVDRFQFRDTSTDY